MANEKFSQLPTVTNSSLADIIAAVQGGTSVQQTLQQIFTLMLSNLVFHNAGDPNSVVAGVVYQFCWDTSNDVLYICTTSGNASTAVWTLAGSFSFPLSVSLGGTGAATLTNHGILLGHGTSAITGATLTNGQLLIGSTGADPVAANLSAGPGISISSGSGTITISGTGSGTGWTEVTGTTQAITADNGYVVNNASLVTLTLPTTAAFGSYIAVQGKGAGGWSIAQNAGQNIQIGSVSSTVGVGGSVQSTNRFDSLELVCITANTTFSSLGGAQGNLTIV